MEVRCLFVDEPLEQLFVATLETPIGFMRATVRQDLLISLSFVADNNRDEFLRISSAQHSPQSVPILALLIQELTAYFNGTLQAFTIPYRLEGTPFQCKAWQMLTQIPYGQTLSYGVQAVRVGNSRAWRAVAQANGANRLAVIVPCHRIVQSNGKIGGYAGGVERKQWLIAHERKHAPRCQN